MSNNRAWMPLHIETYLADTGHLTASEHGAYMLLIMSYWRDGKLPDDERLIARIARMSKEEWAESRDVLAAFFKDGWRHSRIDEELSKADEIIEKRRSAAKGRHSKSKADASAEHVHSKSTDTGVPPITTDLSASSFHSEAESPPSPQGGVEADLFADVWEAFPRNPQSARRAAEKRFAELSPDEQASLPGLAAHYRAWWVEDCAARKEAQADRLRFVPHLSKWLSSGAYLDAAALPVKAAQSQPSADLVVIHADDPRFEAIKTLRGRPIMVGTHGTATFSKAEVEEAMAKFGNGKAA